MLTNVRLAVAGADFGLYLLMKSPLEGESIFPFGGGLSGHHGKINDMTFCGGRSEDSARYVATVSGKTSCPTYPPSRMTQSSQMTKCLWCGICILLSIFRRMGLHPINLQPQGQRHRHRTDHSRQPMSLHSLIH